MQLQRYSKIGRKVADTCREAFRQWVCRGNEQTEEWLILNKQCRCKGLRPLPGEPLTGRFFVKPLGKVFGRVGAGVERMQSGGPCGRPSVERDVCLLSSTKGTHKGPCTTLHHSCPYAIP